MRKSPGVGQESPDAQSVVFEDVFQFFFELPLGEHVLDPAPGSLAFLAGGRGFGPAFGTLYEGIEVMGFFGFPEKLIVNIEMFVFAFAHCSGKALQINRIDQPDS